jgi:malonyl-CoA/methylmalonyl-CoA synthetase
MKLVGYKLPTLLRVLEGELPKGPTGKIQKKVLGPQFFPCPGWQTHPEVQVWRKKTPQIKARL